MIKEIPWIGCNNSNLYYLRALQNSDYHILPVIDAFSGITLLRVKDYPGVIVNHFIDVWGELGIPYKLKGDNVGQTCHFLSLVRKLKGYEKTPLLITHIDENIHVRHRFTKAGADKLMNLFSTTPFKFKRDLAEFFESSLTHKL